MVKVYIHYIPVQPGCCMNGGTCQETDDSKDEQADSLSCRCVYGYYGHRCQLFYPQVTVHTAAEDYVMSEQERNETIRYIRYTFSER